MPKKLQHDIGGDESAYGPIQGIVGEGGRPVKDLLAWEQQCHSLFALLASKKIISTDQLRRAIEALTPEQYDTWSYYERWTATMVSLLIDAQIITHDELQKILFGSLTNEETEGIESTISPKFKTGESVRVKSFLSNTEWKRPHIRTPGYIYGVAGMVERVCGRHGDPSFLAYGFHAPKVQLYRIRFQQCDIWPEQYDPQVCTEQHPGDVVEVEVYEHWLEPADRPSGHSFENDLLFDHTSGDDCGTHHHHHAHDHDHDVDTKDDGPTHESRTTVESQAIQKEGPPTPGKELFQALLRLLLQHEVISSDEIRLMSEKMDTAFERLDGATFVVKAWMDSEFETRLLEDPALAAFELGINTSNPNAPTILTVLKNTSSTHNLVVCTLCSCYPSSLLGIAPSWYKSREYRSRAVREPRRVLEEFGVIFPSSSSSSSSSSEDESTATTTTHTTANSKAITIRVHDSTADHRYMVYPMRPDGTQGWSEDQLRRLITRDTLIGVAIPRLD